MESATSNLDSQEEEKQNKKVIKQRRPIFGNRIYLSHPEANKCLYQDASQSAPLFSDFKSTSMFSMQTNSDNTIRSDESHQTVNLIKPEGAGRNIMDSSTQTSKTILELAQLEKGQLTPDSLTQSPRDQELVKSDLDIPQVKSTLEICSSNSDSIGSPYKQIDSTLTCMRKHEVQENLYGFKPTGSSNSDDEFIVYDHKSLTEMFLEKKQHLPSVCHCRSRFLEQTSPLRKLKEEFPMDARNEDDDKFKSQSCVESYDPGYVCPDKRVFPRSRFTVKSVKEQLSDRPQQRKFYRSPPEAQSSNLKLESLFQRVDGNDNQTQAKILGRNKRESTFMSPTVASEQRNQLHVVENLKRLIVPTRRGKSLSPTRNCGFESTLVRNYNTERIPYIDQSKSQLDSIGVLPVERESPPRISISRRNPQAMMASLATRPTFDEDLLKIDLQSLNIRPSEDTINVSTSLSTASSDNVVTITMNRVRHPDWAIGLQGLAEMTELCRIMDADLLFPHMTIVNQKLLELLRSPRSHVCRTACQAAGHFFESMKDTRRPEFDDIVEILLHKTADANKFIRKDANMSLDCMVTHIPIYHAIRSLCIKGPTHKNPLVRTATIRLIVCAVVIAGADVVLNLPTHEHTRKRIIQQMAKFLEDKHLETRKYGERLYKILCKDCMFETYLKKYLEKEDIARMRNTLKFRMNER